MHFQKPRSNYYLLQGLSEVELLLIFFLIIFFETVFVDFGLLAWGS